MEKIFQNLSEIDKWLDNAPTDLSQLKRGELMKLSVQLMNYSLYLLRVGSSIAPDEVSSHRGFSRNRAIVVGHFVRLTKLCEASLMHISSRQAEVAAIFTRLMFETVIRMFYLMHAKRSSFKSFLLSSYKPEREILEDLGNKAKSRKLIPIESRIRRKIRSRLRRDRITLSTLMANKQWKIDGKDFRQLLKDTGNEVTYAYGFGSASHSVHGDWYDISIQQLEKKGRFYQPKLEYQIPDPRITCAQTHLCLIALHSYVEWNKSDPDNYIRPIIQKAIKLNREIDIDDEKRLGA